MYFVLVNIGCLRYWILMLFFLFISSFGVVLVVGVCDMNGNEHECISIVNDIYEETNTRCKTTIIDKQVHRHTHDNIYNFKIALPTLAVKMSTLFLILK
mmetsp:Transcript_4398/g.6591  ORF Transcript_4398/g.6591 Transcript_4398/m.6591 type:complete len:99 (+) Transcript_4398:892-1188(+)